MCGLNGTWAWLPHRVQTTAKYSRGAAGPPLERPRHRRYPASLAGWPGSLGSVSGPIRTPSVCSTPDPPPSARTRRRNRHRSGSDRRRSRFSSRSRGYRADGSGDRRTTDDQTAQGRWEARADRGFTSSVWMCLSGTHRQAGRIAVDPVQPKGRSGESHTDSPAAARSRIAPSGRAGRSRGQDRGVVLQLGYIPTS